MIEKIKRKRSSNASNEVEEKRSPALHIFLYLLLFSSLGFVLQGLISIYHQFIEKTIKPSAVNEIKGCIEGGFSPGSVKYGIAVLLVSFIIYHLISFFINRKIIKGDIQRGSLIRKFTTYLSMFVLAVMTIGGVIALLLSYFDGEMSLKSFVKIAIFIGFSVFYLGFYLWEIRRENIKGKLFNVLMIISLIFSIVALVIGFVISDSPQVAREKKMDAALVINIESTKYSVSEFYNKNSRLPKAEEFKAKEGVMYKVIEDKSFELCANFKQVASEIEYGSYREEYRHSAGEKCFRYNVECVEEENAIGGNKCSIEIENSDDIKKTCGYSGGTF